MMRDPVDNIHRHFSLTLLNPSSYKISLAITLVSISIITILTNPNMILLKLPIVLGLVYGSTLLEQRLFHSNKVYHIGAFSMIFLLITIVLGMLANILFNNIGNRYILEGIFLIIGFRISLFTVTFTKLYYALPLGMSMPLILLLIISDPYLLLDIKALFFGFLLLSLGIIWTVFADRGGRPWIMSTFKLLQAYLSASTENNPKAIEEMMSSKSSYKEVNTQIISFDEAKSMIIIPDIHPGPFNPVGGSNLPGIIHRYYKEQGINALVMHSISDHTLNIPSKSEVINYVNSLNTFIELDKFDKVSEPIIHNINKARVTGMIFNNNILLLLSLSPYGMEDVDIDIKNAIEDYSKELGINILLIDTHNAIGHSLNDNDKGDMIKACKDVINILRVAKQYPFMVGSSFIYINKEDIGEGGLSVLAFNINNNIYTIGWVDSNNMVKGLREYIVRYLEDSNIKMLDICTSDTHSTSGKARNREGYYTLGSRSDWNDLKRIFLELAQDAIANIKHSNYKLLNSKVRLLLMGSQQFDEYSKALDNSLTLTKRILIITSIVYVIMLILG